MDGDWGYCIHDAVMWMQIMGVQWRFMDADHPRALWSMYGVVIDVLGWNYVRL